jgi:hypothetical protein
MQTEQKVVVSILYYIYMYVCVHGYRRLLEGNMVQEFFAHAPYCSLCGNAFSANLHFFSGCGVGHCSELKQLSTHHKNLNSHAAREQKQKSFDFFASLPLTLSLLALCG